MNSTQKTSAPKVTVAVPLYNKGNFVGRAIESILTQTYEDYEIIVVDDGSTDDGPERVKQFSDPRITIISQPNAGPGAARNKALSLAQSEYITFLDADDEFLPRFLEVTSHFLNEHTKCATVTTGLRVLPERDVSICERDWSDMEEGVHLLDPTTDAWSASWLISQMSPCSTLCRTQALRDHGGFFDDYRCMYAEDQHLFIKIALNYPIGVIKEAHVIYHTECSALASNRGDGLRPVEPFLLDPEPIRAACPTEKLALLEKILEVRAVWAAHYFAQLACNPDHATARAILRRFPHVGGVTEAHRRRAELWAYAPWLGKALRAAKGIISHKQ